MNKLERTLLKVRLLLSPGGPPGDRARGKAYEKHLISAGSNFKIAEGAYIYSPDRLSIGDNVYIGFGSYLGNGPITLGNEVLIGNLVSITAANHLRKNGSFRFGGSVESEVVIGDGTWIAAHACIMAGVSIGRGSLVAAGAVVTKSFGDDVLIAGAPANVIKEIGPE